MTNAIAPIHAGFAGATHRASATHPGFASNDSDPSHGDTTSFAGSPGNKGSASNFGLISGALACCAVVPFIMGLLVMGGLALTAKRAFNGISHLQLPGKMP